MKVNEIYHIDVTDEENRLFSDTACEQEQKNSPASKFFFKKTFLIVTGIHVAILAGVACLAGPMLSTSASEIKHAGVENSVVSQAEQQADKEFVQANSHELQPTPTPSPSPVPTSTPQPTPAPIKPKQSALVKTYIVKQGDTVYSIAKKYKLNTKRLLEINGIKDQNKIVIGQTLKFM